MKAKTIGILASKNLVSQGYPFLEAIYSHLPVCDKIVIGDDSNDGTSQILKDLSKNNKIEVFNLKWKYNKKNTRGGKVIGDVYNNLLNIVKNEYSKKYTWVFEIQANEILEKASVNNITKYLKNYYVLNDKFIKGFLIRYYGFVGYFLVGEALRIRIARLDKDINIGEDGSMININDKNKIKIHKVTKSILSSYIYHNFYNSLIRKVLSDIVIIPNANVFRYGYIFPLSSAKKA